MKIAFLIQDLVGQGVQYATATVARELVQMGHQVDMLLSQVHADYLKKGDVVPFDLDPRVKVIYMPSRKARYNIFFIRKYLRTSDADAILSTSGPYQKALRLATVGYCGRVLSVSMNHGMVGWNQKECRPEPPPARFSWQWIMWRSVYAKFDRAFFVNEFSRQAFLAWTPKFRPEHTHTVCNPCIDQLFFEKAAKGPSHPWLTGKKCRTFICAGAYQPYKDHMTLLRAMKCVQESGRVARLIIFGRGPLESAYREFIRENHLEDVISVGGYTNNLPAEMCAADGFILSSSWESFGIVTVEALASGLPVISTDAIGPTEVLDHGKFGKLVPVGDANALAEAIMNEIDRPSPPPPPESWQRFTAEASAKLYIEGILGR